MKLKKIVALTLAMTMTLGLLASCGKKDPEPTQAANPGTETTDPGTEKKPLNIMMYVIQSLGTLSC